MKNFTISTFFNQLTAMPKRLAMVLTMLFVVGIGNVFGETVTYTIATTTSVNASGDVPQGSSVTFKNTYSNKNQLTAGNTMTLTLEGFDGCTITGITLSMKSNSSSGKGVFSMSVGGTTIAGINEANFSSSTWAGKWSTSYIDIKPSVTQTQVGTDKDVVVSINATANSLYCQSFTITYEPAKPATTYTVKWLVDGQENENGQPTTSVVEGNKVTKLPSQPADCSNEIVFVGWTEEIVTGDKPTDLFTTAANSPAITKNTTFYAVFATETTTGGGSTSKQYSFDITPSNFNTTSYAANNNEKTSTAKASDGSTMSVKWTSNQVMLQSGVMQWQKNTGYIYNSTDLGTINSVTVTSSAGTFTTYYGTSKQPSSSTEVGNGYFQIKVGNATGKTSKITVTFTKTTQGGTTTTYSDYTTSCTAPTEFTVTFDANGHGTAPTAQTITSGEKATEPADPTATGYTFGGWYKESTCTNKFDFNTTITANITLYAKWTPITYTVSFDNNGGTGTMANQTFTYNQAQTLTANTFTRTGYTFNGWNTKSDGSGDSYANSQSVKNLASTNGATITLYAQWKIQTFTVVFDKNGGTGTMASQTFTYNQAQTLTANTFTRTGYTFNGWNTKSDGSGNSYTDKQSITLTAAGLTLYAQWKANTYTVAFNANGGTGTMSNQSFTYGQSQSLTANAFTRTNYAFKNWNTKADGSGTAYTDKQSVSNLTATNGATVTLYAQWTPIYTITWVANGQSHHTQTAVEGTALEMPSAPDVNQYDACEDKVFVGWTETQIVNSTNTKPSDLFTSKSGTLTANKTYYAVFATAEGTPSTDYAKITNINDLADGNYVIAYSYDGGTQVVLKNTTKNTTQMNGTNLSLSSGIYANPDAAYIWQLTKQADGSYYIYNSSVSKYLSATTSALQLSDNPTKYNISYDSSNSRWTIVLKDNSTYYMHGYVSGSSYDFRVSTSGSGNKYRVYLYKNTSTLNYSDYVTTCVAVPDPVLNFATTPADPIEFDPVNCGSTTTKAQAKTVQVSGANLQEYVSVEVTGPYKIARTSSTNLSDYTTSLTLDKTNTGNINANYSTIYIISCPPAQSTDATTGTLTFTTKKGNTLTVNLSTPTVNCTTYALTFNDRGNKTVENYYAGVEVPQPEAPTGVCTDPIHYVFDGWAEATVANGSTEYTKVTFPYTMPGQNKTLYAVYRYLTSGGNGDYNLVTSALDDWSGDYLIAYDNETFADGTVGGETGIGKLNNKVDLSSYISNNIIPATEGDKYKVTLESVTGGYVLKTQDGKYNYHTNNEKNGISATTNINTADDYPINIQFVSQEQVNLCLTGAANGSVLRYNTTGYFRFYKNGGQEPVYLYKKSSGTTLYTTSPICGPLVEITSDKDIYVTGGNAGGTRSLVVAQKKITFSATRLQPNAGGNAPSIKVPAADITIGGNPTTKLALSITQDLTEQGDGTYAGTGEITISYTPTAFNVNEDINVQLRAEYNTGSDVILDAFTVHARSLPQEFVIVAKSGDKWYALNGDMSNGSSANPANGQITLNDDANPTQASYAPCNTIYTFDGLPNTGDRTRVRFQGTDGAWLWAASGTNVGIQNKTLAQTPTGDNKPYNWKLETEDNITYKFHNDNSSRLLGLSGEKFGMYASGVQEFRILPYVEKCLYNYAPTNLKVSELKGSYVTLTWDAVAGATKYQYRTDATNWTDAGTEPTVTINSLSADTEYTYYIRAYHADAGVSQECIDYSEITFTTADCDDVPTDITYTANLNSITVSWTASAATATVKLYSDETGTTTVQTLTDATSPCKFTDLTKNTTYYVQVFSDGTCASQIIKVRTEDVEVEIVEWYDQGIIVDINTDETVGVTLENEVSYGSGAGAEATELFFSKYYEATTNVKLVAIYNGTKNLIDLTDYQIHYGKDSWENQYITLKDFGVTKGQIQPGEEIILYTMSDNDDSDKKIMACVNGDYPDGKWVRVTQSNNEGKGHLSFAGNKTLVLKKAGIVIDVIGALDSTGKPTSKNANSKPSWGDANGWNCATGLSIADDTEIGISTNRCLLIRNNTVTSGANAVTSNIDNFVTLCSEWKGAQVPDSDVDNGVAASCENFAYVGTFDYSDYYTKFESMGEGTTFEENDRNPDGTVTIPITDLYKQSCRNIRVKLSNADGDVLTDREYKVPIMITTTQGTDGQTFIDLQQNLAMIETDGEGNVVATHPLSLEDVREICKTCDVVIRNKATLTKVTDGTTNDHPQVRNIYVYEGASLEVDGANHNYTINSLSLRRKGDVVASVNVQNAGQLILPNDAAAPISLTLRVDAQNWHWFTLPYDCNIADVTWVDGSPAQHNVDWFLMTYDGESRSKEQSHYENHWKKYFGTTIEAGKGYIVGITGDINNPEYTFELRFPMATEVLTKENGDKTVPVNAWGVKDDITPNKKGWNLVGNPYLDYYQPSSTGFTGLSLIQYTSMDPMTGEWNYDESGSIPFIVTPVDGGWYEYKQELASEVEMMPFTAYFVQVGDPEIHENGAALNAEFIPAKRGRASLIQRAANEVDEVEEPAIVRVTLTNAKGESDKTSLIIDDQYTDEYEMNVDFFKWFGDYYKYYTKPVLYTIGADQGKRAFNAISEDLATQPISLGMYAAQAGNYTFSLDLRSDLSKVQEVWLYDATQDTYTNLLQDSYTFQTAKTESAGRFFLSVKMAPKVSTNIDNIADGTIWATTQDHTIIVNGLLSNAQLWIYDATGKLLHTDQTQYYQHTYSVPQAGTYFVRVQNTMQTQTIKVVVE